MQKSTQCPIEHREKLVLSTLKAGWVKFGAPELDTATLEYVTGIACSVIADAAGDLHSCEKELQDNLGAILQEHGLKQKQASILCKATARCAAENGQLNLTSINRGAEEARLAKEEVLCRRENLMLMYMGSTRLLLKDTTFELLKGHRYGMVGSNGSGKTTLMERICDGDISDFSTSNLRFVHLRHDNLNERTDPKTVAAAYAQGVVGPDVDMDDAFAQVGFTEELKKKRISELSGGWRVRLLLATAVARHADVLLLDEPTNHLDAVAVAWLVNYLTNDLREATSIIVSHDGSFLDETCTDIIHFEDCQLKYYIGNFASFRKQAQLDDPQAVRALLQVRQDGESGKPGGDIPAVMDEKRSRGRKSSGLLQKTTTYSATAKPDGEAHPAVSAAQKIAEAASRMCFPVPGKVEGVSTAKKTIIEIKDASYKYPIAKDYALRHVSGKITMSSRVAIVGPNGAGKSTLMAMLCGENMPSPDEKGICGEVLRNRNLRVAFIAQNHAFHLQDYSGCSAVEYIQLRFRFGYDEELQKRLNLPADEKETAALDYLAKKYGKYSKRVESIESRTTRKGEFRYEVKWAGCSEKVNTFESLAKLRQLGVERMATALDERLAAVKSGIDERPLTTREIVKHCENFGLSEELVTLQTINTFSGGQKSKLMIAAAFWTKPHLICLDEPTNFLDIETVGSLARALKNFRGGVVVVSHNHDFVASVCNETWTVENHELTITNEAPQIAHRDNTDG